jgi:hypothetical protein
MKGRCLSLSVCLPDKWGETLKKLLPILGITAKLQRNLDPRTQAGAQSNIDWDFQEISPISADITLIDWGPVYNADITAQETSSISLAPFMPQLVSCSGPRGTQVTLQFNRVHAVNSQSNLRGSQRYKHRQTLERAAIFAIITKESFAMGRK